MLLCHWLLVVLLSCGILIAPALAGEASGDPLSDLIEELKDLYDGANDVYNDLNDLIENRQQCLQRGFSAEQCDQVAAFCFIKTRLIRNASAPWASLFSDLQLFDLFQVDCGSGDCYQRCHVPGSGCHTSFVGFPVINCKEETYGPGTNAAGLALVLDSQPGQACLVTPQTCGHIPKCVAEQVSGRSAPGLTSLAQGIDLSLLSDPRAIKQRARVFTQSLLEEWAKLLDGYHSEQRPLNALVDFVTGKGCRGWAVTGRAKRFASPMRAAITWRDPRS
jgi:hypothetical protein